jgi:hypothetical protein
LDAANADFGRATAFTPYKTPFCDIMHKGDKNEGRKP